ncbi:MAG: HRDC domain-containing protein [Myxococcota bacterium]|nr:HRDC domain-containing protein [Myxococcota bacterium]
MATIAAALAAAPVVAFDLEFLSQDRLTPTLCLVQVAWSQQSLDAEEGPNVALVDPLAVDVGPIVKALAAHTCAIVHAGRQDLALLAARFGVTMPHILDTQVMAAFAGVGDQVGFATLANELLGTSLGKELQWTDWGRRPLSDAQIAYADSDVRHLPAIYAQLAKRLGPRLAWARAESALVAADAYAATQVTPETAWRQVGGVRGLDAAALARVAALAAWRQRTAIELDRPLGQVLNDKVLVDIVRLKPDDEDALRSMKGISPIARKRAGEILSALEAPASIGVEPPPLSRAASTRAQRWAEMLLAIVQLVAEQTGVAARLLATRADAEELARVVDERGLDAAQSLPALATWRRDVLGLAWLGWLGGTHALVGDATKATGLALVPLGSYDQPTQK